jgi:hypothetical protein
MAEITVCEASRINRRATKAEMEERAGFLIDYAEEHGPVTVRGWGGARRYRTAISQSALGGDRRLC